MMHLFAKKKKNFSCLHLQRRFIVYLCASLQVWAVVKKNRKQASFL